MSSNKSIVASKKTITRTMFSNILKNNKELNSLETSLDNSRIRCKLLWYTSIKLNQQIDNFEDLYGSLDDITQEKLLDKLLKKSDIIYQKYIECGEIEKNLEYEIDEVIFKIESKYNIVNTPVSVMSISKYGRGTRKQKKNKRKKNQTIQKNITKNMK